MQNLRSIHSFFLRFILFSAGLLPCQAFSQEIEIIYSDHVGRWPRSKLVEGADGNFYGTTPNGGAGDYEADGYGTVFKVTPAGVRTTVLSFNKIQGSHPMAGLILGADGNFYGTTSEGGTHQQGTIFRMTPGGALTTLVSLNIESGSLPKAALIQAGDGNFYGTCSGGGSAFRGTVFRMTPAGTLTVLASFTDTHGRFPLGGLVQGPGGDFFGTTEQGGAHDRGTVFKITAAGELTTLFSFDETTGQRPHAGLALGGDGNFYGTTRGAPDGAASGQAPGFFGSAFKVTPEGVLTTLIFFDGTNGRWPQAELLMAADGNFYGTTFGGGANGAGGIFRITPAGSVTIHASMNGAETGANLKSALMQASDGNFYGAASSGLYGSPAPYGTIYKMNPAGVLTRLALFDHPHGAIPLGSPAQDPAGNFYLTASKGGREGHGTVLKITSSGAATRLVDFDGPNGSVPAAGLKRGTDGNLYGTTKIGGTYMVSGSPVEARGTVFRVTPSGVLTTLVTFRDSNGARPEAGLILGSDGAFYGTTKDGGEHGRGTVFRMTPAGAHTVLKSLSYDQTVFAPMAALVQGSDGNFYGTAAGGFDNFGAVFRLTPDGAMSVVHLFDPHGSPLRGQTPTSELVEGSSGEFFGTSKNGGDILFKLTASGTRSNLVEFNRSEQVRGYRPGSGLVKGPDGNFYGVNEVGGAKGAGTVFRLTPGGGFTTLAAFDGLSAANPRGTPIFGADGKLYGSAGQLALWRLALPGAGTPVAVTLAADPLGARQATLQGTINAQGQGFAEGFFRYGTDSALVGAVEVDALSAAGGSTDTPFHVTVSDLLPNTQYYCQAVARLGSTQQSGTIVGFRTLTRLQQWRQDYFGITGNTGAAADPEDPDGDGLVNLMEFALGSSPMTHSLSTLEFPNQPPLAGFSYTRSSAAVADGLIFTVEWSASLAPDSWSSSGINSFALPGNGGDQRVIVSMSTTGARKFVRLKVEIP